jgi:CheY-like chemotaxis protein
MNEQKTTILVVDDAPANIQLLSGVLREKYKVKAATSGVKALAVSQKTPPPDLILLDIIMPELDGYEVCRQLKTNPATMDIPVVFITGNISSQDEQRGLEMGAVAYLGKPIDSGKLLETVERILG